MSLAFAATPRLTKSPTMTRIPSAYPHVPSRLPRRFSTLRPQRTATSYPARLAGDPSNLHTRGRPLTFPLGSLLGFFVGFATAGIAGYTYLLHSHAALQAASRAAVADLERIVGEMEASSAELLGGTGGTTVVGELQARLSEVQAQVGVLGDQRKREREQREASRVEARVVGVEEELVEVRDTLLALGEPKREDRCDVRED